LAGNRVDRAYPDRRRIRSKFTVPETIDREQAAARDGSSLARVLEHARAVTQEAREAVARARESRIRIEDQRARRLLGESIRLP
jgi:hypothetical protein